MNPLLTFTSLTSDVKELVRQFADLEGGLRDTSRLYSAPQDILICRHVSWCAHAVDCIEVIDGGIIQLELSRPTDSFFYTGISPESPNSISDIPWKNITLNLAREGKDYSATSIILR